MSRNVKDEIIDDLSIAKTSIKVAVSWLTDIDLVEKLIEAAKRDVEISIVVGNSSDNLRRQDLFRILNECGGQIRRWGSNDPLEGAFMHYKFYIIDNKIAKSGSYNWTVSATINKETLDAVEVSRKIQEFNNVFELAQDYFEPFTLTERKSDNGSTIELVSLFNSNVKSIKLKPDKQSIEYYYPLEPTSLTELKLFWKARLKKGEPLTLSNLGFESGVIDNKYNLLDSYWPDYESFFYINRKAYVFIFKKDPEVECFSIKLKKKDNEQTYYMPNDIQDILKDNVELILYPKSIFVRDGTDLKLNSREEYERETMKWIWACRNKQSLEEEKLKIEVRKIALNSSERIADVFKYRNKYFFSENLIKKIEAEGLTGFSFTAYRSQPFL